MKLDLEAVVEDASDEVYSFQIPKSKSLIYWKFVGVVHHQISVLYLRILSWIDFLLRISLKEGLFSRISSYSAVSG